jgi:hypothetical protein
MMDERVMAALGQEHLAPAAPLAPGEIAEAGMNDPKVIQILSTEHWSLLSARSLVYNEAFARAGMFLTFVSASLVALGFAASAMAFSHDFLVLAVGLLSLDLVIGLATIGRIMDATLDDLHSMQGMNRIRNAYVQLAPAVRPYLGSIHDDAPGVLGGYGGGPSATSLWRALLHGFTTTNSMVAAINAILSGALTALVATLLGSSSAVAFLAALLAIAVVFAAESRYALQTIRGFERRLESHFPTPSIAPLARPEGER